MYRYDEFDHQFVRGRTAQFRTQVERRLDGRLTEAEFRPLRLMNGLYLQLHAYMLRVAVPYGTLSSKQLRQLAMIGDKYDRGYGHITTRQNIQFNWPELTDVPDILDDLADVEMHAIQTSGNCIRNVTSDPWAGCTADEIEDPRPTCEVLRQWSSLHPEFTFLPRKFKIAVNAAPEDRAAIRAHDIGIQIVKNDEGEAGYHVLIGGGLGRTPIMAQTLREFLPREELLPYLEATMRIYNRYGRRDNKYKARVKILVTEEGIDKIRAEVDAEYATMTPADVAVDAEEVARITAYFAAPEYEALPETDADFERALEKNAAFADWVGNNVVAHKQGGYAIVNISLKPEGAAPGDITCDQMRLVADLSDKFSFGEVRATHEQNLVMPYVRKADLFALYMALSENDLAAANIGLISDIICCPGMDYCALATARSIPIAQAIAERFSDTKRQKAIGEMKIKISGCINACGHHHVGHIGILGLEKAGVENYQVKLGGDATQTAAVGQVTGKGFEQDDLIDAIERMVDYYLDTKEDGERFLDTYRRVGIAPFKEVLYGAA